MHINNVQSYAPPGYRLTGTDYTGGTVRHTFARDGAPDLVCECSPDSAVDERAALEAFRAKWTPVAPTPVAEPARKPVSRRRQ